MASEGILMMIRVFVAAYPYAKEITSDTVKVYAAMLADIDPDILDQALKMCLASCKFFPTIAEIREKAAEFQGMASRMPIAGEAWNEVLNLIRAIGHNGRPEYSHPIIGKAVGAVGGWYYLCMSEDIVADRARFFQVFDQLTDRAMRETRYLPETTHAAATLGTGTVGAEIKRLSALMGGKS